MAKTAVTKLVQAPDILEVGMNLKILGEQLRNGQVELKHASELANIYGKELKAQQLVLAERIFMKDSGTNPPQLPT